MLGNTQPRSPYCAAEGDGEWEKREAEELISLFYVSADVHGVVESVVCVGLREFVSGECCTVCFSLAEASSSSSLSDTGEYGLVSCSVSVPYAW